MNSSGPSYPPPSTTKLTLPEPDMHPTIPSTPPTHTSSSATNTSSTVGVSDTPPASTHNTPVTGDYKPVATSSTEEVMDTAGGGGGNAEGGYVPAWAVKRAVEEAEQAREKIVDVGFGLQWAGDDYDEGDMRG
ncbi:hypothetical protein RUND412_000889 [Rhizina undulata]